MKRWTRTSLRTVAPVLAFQPGTFSQVFSWMKRGTAASAHPKSFSMGISATFKSVLYKIRRIADRYAPSLCLLPLYWLNRPRHSSISQCFVIWHRLYHYAKTALNGMQS